MKKVVLIEPHGDGGICHYTYGLASALSESGVHVTVFTNDTYELEGHEHSYEVKSLSSSALKNAFTKGGRSTEEASGTPIMSTDDSVSTIAVKKKGPWRDAYLIFELVFRILGKRIRTIHMQWIWPSRYPCFFVRVSKLFRRRIVYTAHNLLPHDDESPRTTQLMKKFYNLVDHIIVHSDGNSRELHKLFSVPKSKISVIPHGNYAFLRDPNEKGCDQARQKLDIGPDRKVVLFFGGIQKYKGLDVLIEAFKEAYKVRNDLFLVIAGDLDEYDGKDSNYFEKKIEKLARDGATRMDLGYVPMEDVGVYFAASDLVAIPYLKTYQSGIVQLAFAYGRPVIVTRTGGLPEVVDEKMTGSIVEPNCVTGLAKEILRLFECEDTLKKMGERAFETSQSVYSWDAIAAKTDKLY